MGLVHARAISHGIFRPTSGTPLVPVILYLFFSQTAVLAFAPRLALMSIMITLCRENIKDGPANSLVPLCVTYLRMGKIHNLKEQLTLIFKASTFYRPCRAPLTGNSVLHKMCVTAEMTQLSKMHLSVLIKKHHRTETNMNQI